MLNATRAMNRLPRASRRLAMRVPCGFHSTNRPGLYAPPNFPGEDSPRRINLPRCASP